LALFESIEPTSNYRALVWLIAARALQGSDAPFACRVVQQAAHWLHESARERVPPEFRDSFLHRNPVNRDLLALAARSTAR